MLVRRLGTKPGFVARAALVVCSGKSISVLPWAVFATAMLGSFVATWQAARAAEARAESRFRERAAETGAAIQSKLDLYQVILNSTAGLFIASDHVTPSEFATFIAPIGISEHFLGLRSISFVPRVDREHLHEFERALSEYHGRAIEVWPKREADEFYPVAVAAPMDEGQLITIGFDLAGEASRLAALKWAVEAGEAAATGPVEIAEAIPAPRRGFLIALPIFGVRSDHWEALLGGRALWPPPADVDERVRQLRGFIVGAFIMEDIVEGVRGRRPRTGLPLAIFDGPDFTDEALLFATPRSMRPDQAAVSETLGVAGRTWTILFFDPGGTGGWANWLGLGPHAAAESRFVPIIALLGVGFSIALFVVTRAQVRARSAAEQAASEAQEQRLIAAESERRFRMLADAAPVIIWMAAPAGGIIWLNLAALEFTGQPLEELTDEGWLNVVHEEDRQSAAQAYSDALKERRPFAQQSRLRRSDGAYRWLVITGRPVFRADGEYAGYIGTGMDITDEKRAMEQLHEQASELESVNRHLERLNSELARSNAELADFASIAAHDLKEPLRGMGNYARFILEDFGEQIPPKGRDMLETIERLASRLGRLLDALMDYARVGRGELQLEETDLDEVCRQVTEGLNAQLSDPDVEVVCRPLPRVRCDPILISQLISNLIMNGLKYNTSIPRRIEIGALKAPEGPILYVRDNGIGISPQHHDRIFKMFKRLHTREAYGGGLGAGLAIVKKILERHDGRIWIASEVGQGTTFYFTLGPEPRHIPAEAHAAQAG